MGHTWMLGGIIMAHLHIAKIGTVIFSLDRRSRECQKQAVLKLMSRCILQVFI